MELAKPYYNGDFEMCIDKRYKNSKSLCVKHYICNNEIKSESTMYKNKILMNSQIKYDEYNKETILTTTNHNCSIVITRYFDLNNRLLEEVKVNKITNLDRDKEICYNKFSNKMFIIIYFDDMFLSVVRYYKNGYIKNTSGVSKSYYTYKNKKMLFY